MTKGQSQGCRWLWLPRLHVSVMDRAAKEWCALRGASKVMVDTLAGRGQGRHILTANGESSILA